MPSMALMHLARSLNASFCNITYTRLGIKRAGARSDSQWSVQPGILSAVYHWCIYRKGKCEGIQNNWLLLSRFCSAWRLTISKLAVRWECVHVYRLCIRGDGIRLQWDVRTWFQGKCSFGTNLTFSRSVYYTTGKLKCWLHGYTGLLHLQMLVLVFGKSFLWSVTQQISHII